MLYNNYRPTDFSEVRGQEDVLLTLKKQSAENRFGHAYLLAGHRGTGKTTIARILSKAVNCEHPTENGPCKACASCQAAKDSMDIIELDAASNNGVDKIKELMAQTKYHPVQLKKKVIIIDEVHNLSTAAFDALLKPLEEPPSFCVFILCTTELHKIPVTVKSRCEKYQFHPISDGPMRERLKEVLENEKVSCDEDALSLIVRCANGGLRDSLGLTEQLITCSEGTITYETAKRVLGMQETDRILECMDACIREDTKKTLNILDDLLTAGTSPSLIVDTCLQVLMDLITVKTTGTPDSIVHGEEYRNALYALSQAVSFERLYWLCDHFCTTKNALRSSVEKTMDVRLLLIRASNREIISCDTVELAEEVSELKREVERLKSQIAQGNFRAAEKPERAPEPKQEQTPPKKAETAPETEEGFLDAPPGIVPFAPAEDEDITAPGAEPDQSATQKEGGMQQDRTEIDEKPQDEATAESGTEISASDLFKIFG